MQLPEWRDSETHARLLRRSPDAREGPNRRLTCRALTVQAILAHRARPAPPALSPEGRGFLGEGGLVMVRPLRAAGYEQPVVVPQVMHFRQVPLRTMVN